MVVMVTVATVEALALVAIAIFLLFTSTIYHVPQSTVVVVERHGRFSRLLYEGFHILVPFLDQPRRLFWTGRRPGLVRVDLREQFISLPFQPVLTKDGLTVAVDTGVYWRVMDPRKAVYGPADLTGRVTESALTALCTTMSTLQHTATSSEGITARMQQLLDGALTGWGLTATRVDVRGLEVIDAAPSAAVAEEHFLVAVGRACTPAASSGMIFESLEGEKLLAYNAERILEPASVVKIATSAAAIERLGPEYRFSTRFYTNGRLDVMTGELTGDLIIRGSGDPVFLIENAFATAGALRACGVARVVGELVVTGAFFCNRAARQRAGAVLKAALNQDSWAGELEEAFDRYRVKGAAAAFESVVITGDAVYSADLPAEGLTLLFTHQSAPLVGILNRMNTYSDNWIAAAVGSSIGGPSGVENALITHYGLSRPPVRLVTTSGLGLNGATNGMRPVDITSLLRSLVVRLGVHGYAPPDIMPVAGPGGGTLEERCFPPHIAKSVVAKSGTLWRGISALAGYMYTKNRGIIVFAIMNEVSNPYLVRRSQDLLVREMFEVYGGPAPVPPVRSVGRYELRGIVIEPAAGQFAGALLGNGLEGREV